ncbi:MAG: hypothetical protein WC307_00845 [Candidatus Nanoarchaeia archaeon]
MLTQQDLLNTNKSFLLSDLRQVKVFNEVIDLLPKPELESIADYLNLNYVKKTIWPTISKSEIAANEEPFVDFIKASMDCLKTDELTAYSTIIDLIDNASFRLLNKESLKDNHLFDFYAKKKELFELIDSESFDEVRTTLGFNLGASQESIDNYLDKIINYYAASATYDVLRKKNVKHNHKLLDDCIKPLAADAYSHFVNIMTVYSSGLEVKAITATNQGVFDMYSDAKENIEKTISLMKPYLAK